jgi:hypothetical protein
LSTIGFRDERSFHQLYSIRPALQSPGKLLKIILQVLAVMLPIFTIHLRRCIAPEAEVNLAKVFDVIDVMP